jgi:hypothetical protein
MLTPDFAMMNVFLTAALAGELEVMRYLRTRLSPYELQRCTYDTGENAISLCLRGGDWPDVIRFLLDECEFATSLYVAETAVKHDRISVYKMLAPELESDLEAHDG